MSVIEHILRLRDEASPALGKTATAAQRAEHNLRELNAGALDAERGMKKLAQAFGFGEKAEKLEHLSKGVQALGPAGAVAGIGMAAITTGLVALGAELRVIMELGQYLDGAARSADTLAPKLERIAGISLVSDQSLASANAYEAQMDAMSISAQGFGQVLVNEYAPAMDRASAVVGGLTIELVKAYAAMADFARASNITDTIVRGLAGNLTGGLLLKGGEAFGAAVGSVLDPFAAEGTAAGIKAQAEARSEAARGKGGKAGASKAATTPKTASPRAPSAAERYAVTGPTAAASMADVGDLLSEVSDELGGIASDQLASVSEVHRQIAPYLVDIDLSAEQAGEAINELSTTLAENRKKTEAERIATRDANLSKATQGVNLASSIAGGGVGAISGALGSSEDKGVQLAGGLLGLADVIRTQGAEGLQAQVDSIMSLIPEVLAELPAIIAEVIPKLLTEGIPALIGGILQALPAIMKAVWIDFPVAMFKGLMQWFKTIWQSLKDLFSLGDPEKKAERQAKRAARRAGGEDYQDPAGDSVRALDGNAQARTGGGSTGRSSGNGGGGLTVNLGALFGTDAKAARDISRLLKSHVGTRGTGLALG